MGGVSIRNFTTLSYGGPSVFSAIAKEVLPDWDISLAFVGATRARTLNKKLRGKNYVPNVLSYAAGKKSGEIIICSSEAKKQASSYDLPPSAYYVLLFIHGLLHLKGWKHGARMEKCERDLLSRYETTRRRRYRHRHIPSKDRRR